jgi:hypothetical protein
MRNYLFSIVFCKEREEENYELRIRNQKPGKAKNKNCGEKIGKQ